MFYLFAVSIREDLRLKIFRYIVVNPDRRMPNVNEKLKEKIKESLSSVLPITVIVLLLSVTLVPMEIGTLALFLTGAVLLIVGMGFFSSERR